MSFVLFLKNKSKIMYQFSGLCASELLGGATVPLTVSSKPSRTSKLGLVPKTVCFAQLGKLDLLT